MGLCTSILREDYALTDWINYLASGPARRAGVTRTAIDSLTTICWDMGSMANASMCGYGVDVGDY